MNNQERRTPRRSAPMSLLSFLDREHTVAKPGYSRWMVPPAALCVHLCIGQAYALSVFNLPMTKLIGITQSAPGDWKLTELGCIFSIAMVFLGGSAAGLRTAVRAEPCSPLRFAGLEDSFFRRSVSIRTHCGSSTSATVCSVAAGSA